MDGAGTEGIDASMGDGVSPTLDWNSDYDSSWKCDLMSGKRCFSVFQPPFCMSRHGYLIRVTLFDTTVFRLTVKVQAGTRHGNPRDVRHKMKFWGIPKVIFRDRYYKCVRD